MLVCRSRGCKSNWWHRHIKKSGKKIDWTGMYVVNILYKHFTKHERETTTSNMFIQMMYTYVATTLMYKILI